MFKTIITFILLCTSAYAVHGRPNHYELYQEQVPSFCGVAAEVDRYITDNKLEPIAASVGREGSLVDGKIVYLVTQYSDKAGKQLLVTLDWPGSEDRCILYHTYDLVPIKIGEKI